MFVGFMGVGIIFLVVGLFLFWLGMRYALRVIRLPGRLVAHKRLEDDEEDGGVIVRYYPVVEFEDPNREIRRVTLPLGEIRPVIKLGSKVEVYYDPKRPDRVQTASFENIGCFPIMSALATFVGAMAFLVGLLMWLYGKPN